MKEKIGQKMKQTTDWSADFLMFWSLYPARQGRKIGKTDCWKWWQINKPDKQQLDKMLAWLQADNIARQKSQRAGLFYPNPKDPERWLKKKGWLDDVDYSAKVDSGKRDWTCKKCGRRTASLSYRNLCSKCEIE